LGEVFCRGGNGFDSIEKRVENPMLAKQGVGQLHGRYLSPVLGAKNKPSL
jgi:hypothetical protein